MKGKMYLKHNWFYFLPRLLWTYGNNFQITLASWLQDLIIKGLYVSHECMWVLSGCFHCHIPPLIFSGWSLLSLKSEGASGAEKNDSSLPPGDVGYDNVEDNITATSLQERLSSKQIATKDCNLQNQVLSFCLSENAP